ncbi:uncharacterized protein LOC116340913 isoform X2 [Contarinia nasturtii]|uniref:uncharacterized protein LOC116340913 isoform X2 n=1 Tax=Contarinia nasturtii TaxID=265458 RepID=UPI0012D4286C|nr:uncharacterized protein LOC116340913 isoform X2 [Contarinia nasturtii]
MMSMYRTIKSKTSTMQKRRRERSLGPLETLPREMVSRRKILSRSRDDLNLEHQYQQQQDDEEDVWYQKDKLYKEHIQEVLDKWTQIDDEIWAKVIVFERNRRVAKAYARAPVLTINGSDDGFDGMRIGLSGFDNPMRDPKTEELKRHVGQGVKIKMDDAGNILIRRYAKSNVYVKSTAANANDETAIGAEILKLPNSALESEKIVKLFDMKKFQSNVNRELRRAYPDRRRLETQCLSLVAFVKAENDLLDCPIWVLIVNVVAMDMLKSKLPPVHRPLDIKNRPRIPIPDEDPYSIAGHVASTREQLLLQTQKLASRRSEKPPKLPPRDNIYHPHDIPKPDYDDINEDDQLKAFRVKSDKGRDLNKKYDDPYYCGLRARVPNFVKSSKNKGKESLSPMKRISVSNLQHPSAASLASLHQLHQMHPQHLYGGSHHAHSAQYPHHMMLHTRSFESGIDSDMIESPYNHIYGRLPLPTRGYVPQQRAMYIGEWD